MAFIGKKNETGKAELRKPKEMEALIKSKIGSPDKAEGFSLVKVEPDYLTLEQLDNAHYKAALAVLKKRIDGILTDKGCFCRFPDGSIIIYLDKKYSEPELSEIGWHIITECCQTIELESLPVNPEINAGLAVYPDSGRTYEALNSSLSIAVTVSKKEGVNTFSVYTPKLTAEKSREYMQLAELKDGVNKNQFLLHYQPIIDIRTSVVYGAEALLRWKHPMLGIVSPKDFFNVIEASGEIYRLGLWTFGQMLEQWAQWRITSESAMMCSINLSAKQLIHPSLPDDIRRVMKRIPDLAARNICFEISGVTAMLQEENMMSNLSALSKMGFKIAIDNFGDAEFPLNTLWTLPVNIIKLSGSCFSGAGASDKTEKLKQLLWRGREEGIAFIAEGIENETMLARAEGLGIVFMQGFYFARPVPAEDFGYAAARK